MDMLIDTHALIWWMIDPARLSQKASHAIADAENAVLVSAVVAWELAIKINTGKIQPSSLLLALDAAFARQAFVELSVSVEQAVKAGLLPLHHRDPFDRLLVAQAQALNVPIVSVDATLDRYGIRRLW
jgi:PIN domain nuclease of toxin-antitoxin system